MSGFDQWAADLARHVRESREAPAVKCETCQDEGVHMDMRCYGGPPVEIQVYCIDCGGGFAGDPVDDGIRDT